LTNAGAREQWREMKPNSVLVFLVLIVAALPSPTGAQVRGAPNGICQEWNGREFVTRPCSSGSSGSARNTEPRDSSVADEARSFDRAGKLFYERGQLQEAQEQFEKARRLNQYDGAAYYGLCLVQAAWGNFAFAASNCSAAMTYGTSPVWSIARRELQTYLGDLRKKAEDARVADGKAADAQAFQRCEDLYKEMDWERALYFLDYYTDPKWVGRTRVQEGLVMKGAVLIRLGRFREAEQALHAAYVMNPQRALQDVRDRKKPNLAELLWDLEFSRALAVEGKDDDSKLLRLSLLQQSLRFSPDNYRSLYLLADAELDVGYDLGAANEHLRRALEQLTVGAQPFHSYPEVVNFAKGVQIRQEMVNDRLKIANDAEGKANALEAAGKTEADVPLSDGPTSLRAQALMIRGQPDKAMPLIKGLMTKYPDNGIFRIYADALSRLIVHQPIYVTEATRQAETVRKNGRESVLYEIDQNMRCVAGQTFDGVGTCINNGFSWPQKTP
jgi:tetratricopeptide (TPR) repeat protein